MADGGRSPARVAPAVAAAATMSWAPALTLALVRVLWSDAPERVPVHWSGSGADQWGSTSGFFWTMLVPGVAGAAVCTLLTVPLSHDVSRRAAALTLGSIAGGTGGIAMVWVAALLSATNTAAPFLVVLAGICWGAAVLGVALIRMPARRRIR